MCFHSPNFDCISSHKHITEETNLYFRLSFWVHPFPALLTPHLHTLSPPFLFLFFNFHLAFSAL